MTILKTVFQDTENEDIDYINDILYKNIIGSKVSIKKDLSGLKTNYEIEETLDEIEIYNRDIYITRFIVLKQI